MRAFVFYLHKLSGGVWKVSNVTPLRDFFINIKFLFSKIEIPKCKKDSYSNRLWRQLWFCYSRQNEHCRFVVAVHVFARWRTWWNKKLVFWHQRQVVPPLRTATWNCSHPNNVCRRCGVICRLSSILHSCVYVFMYSCRFGVSCERQNKEESPNAPSYTPAGRSCTFQAMALLFSCVAKDSSRMRLCPCRDYQPQQVAFCKNCDWHFFKCTSVSTGN